MRLSYPCPKCGKSIYTKYLKAGEEARCRHCGNRSAVPSYADTASVPDGSDVPRPYTAGVVALVREVSCRRCHKSIPSGCSYCPHCGEANPGAKGASASTTHVRATGGAEPGLGVSTASLVLGLLGVFPAGPLTSIPAILLGKRALGRGYAGRGMAKAGVILGWAVTTVFLVVIAAIVILIVFYQSLAHGPSSPN